MKSIMIADDHREAVRRRLIRAILEQELRYQILEAADPST